MGNIVVVMRICFVGWQEGRKEETKRMTGLKRREFYGIKFNCKYQHYAFCIRYFCFDYLKCFIIYYYIVKALT